MTRSFLIAIFVFVLGFSFVDSAFKGESSKNKSDKQIKIFFLFGWISVIVSIICFSVLFYNIGSAGKKESKKETKKDMVFVVQKKLNDNRMEILALDEDVRFEVKKDGVYILPIFKQSISLSDVKEMTE